jgi:arylsulfatase A-like enzyme
MADDIGIFNISAYNMGMMGYRTLNVDRIASDGTRCTAGARRSSLAIADPHGCHHGRPARHYVTSVG